MRMFQTERKGGENYTGKDEPLKQGEIVGLFRLVKGDLSCNLG